MIITLKTHSDIKCIHSMIEELESLNFECQTTMGKHYTVVHVLGDTTKYDAKKLYAYDCVKSVVRIQEPFKKAQKQNANDKTLIKVKDIVIGGDKPVYIAGPCSVESQEQIEETAKLLAALGAHVLRGGAFKPRTSPYDFQGLGKEGLEFLSNAAKKYGLVSISEIVNHEDLPIFESTVDIIQVGARNMQNFTLLKALGSSSKPVLLKRGFGNTIEEWLMSAEYVITHGNPNVILCERGIRTFEPQTRHTLDLSSVLLIKHLSHLPVIVDPSHAAGRWELIDGLSRAAIAAGADGIMVEVHLQPERAFSDGAQALKPERFEALIKQLNQITEALNKK